MQAALQKTIATEQTTWSDLVDYGTAEQKLVQCVGDDPTYDYNAYAASLAVAIANELGRWGCDRRLRDSERKARALDDGRPALRHGMRQRQSILRLQDDASSVVANHSPSIFRSKLTSWYQKQTQKLSGLVDSMLKVDKGIYRVKAKHSGKYMAVDGAEPPYKGRSFARLTLSVSAADAVVPPPALCRSSVSSFDWTRRRLRLDLSPPLMGHAATPSAVRKLSARPTRWPF